MYFIHCADRTGNNRSGRRAGGAYRSCFSSRKPSGLSASLADMGRLALRKKGWRADKAGQRGKAGCRWGGGKGILLDRYNVVGDRELAWTVHETRRAPPLDHCGHAVAAGSIAKITFERQSFLGLGRREGRGRGGKDPSVDAIELFSETVRMDRGR